MNNGLSISRAAAGVAISAYMLVGTVAQAQDGDVNAFIAKAPIAGLPQGPYARWTDDQKKQAVARISGFCQFLCVDSYRNASVPDEAAADRMRADIKVCLGACIVNHLPPDHPQLPGLMSELRANYETAKQMGSQAPWPLPGK
jgi:hypothetical protein